MKKRFVVLLALVTILALPVTSMATDILSFNDTNLGWIDTGSWDWNVGNALAVDSVPLPQNPSTSDFTIYYQADLQGFNDANGSGITGTGLGTAYEITIQAGFGETGSRIDLPNGTSIATFNLDTTSNVNFINMYYDTNVNADSLAGTGFDDGSLLMSGYIDSSTGSYSVTFDTNGDGVLDYTLLDNFGSNDYPDIYTLSGVGATTVGAIIDVANVDSTLIDTSGMDLNWVLDLFFNSSNITPFSQQDPAAQVYGITPTFGTYVDANGNPITVNGFYGTDGTPVDFLFQSDGNSSVAIVPEPATIMLLGFGLAGLGFYNRRRNK